MTDMISIGEVEWSNTNLHSKNFANGEIIPYATSIEDVLKYASLQMPCYCYLEFDEKNAKYGAYYNWYAVTDIRGLAPSGFHICNPDEVDKLKYDLQSLNNYENGEIEKEALFGQLNFNPRPIGYLNVEDGELSCFSFVNDSAWFWIDGQFENDAVWAPAFNICTFDDEIWTDLTPLFTINNDWLQELKGSMLPVRCIKDKV